MILIISSVFIPEPLVSASLSFDIADKLSTSDAVTVLAPYPTRPLGCKYDSSDFGEYKFRIVRLNSYTCAESQFIGRFRENYSFGKACSMFIRQYRTQIKCIYANVGPIFAQKQIVSVANKYKIPVVIHIQDLYPESLSSKLPSWLYQCISKLLLNIDQKSMSKADAIIAISDGMKNTLLNTRKLHNKKVHVVQNWQNEEEFLAYYCHEIAIKPYFTFMYLGNIGPVAGVELLIESFAKLNDAKTRLIIAGGGSQKEKCKEAAKRYPNSIIEFFDVPNGAVAQMQAQADCFLLPIKRGAATSSIPSKLPAYMFSSKPIIGSMDIDCHSASLIRNAQCGLIVPPEDINELCQAMKQMLSYSTIDLENMGKNSKNYALQYLSKSTNLSKLIHIIKSL